MARRVSRLTPRAMKLAMTVAGVAAVMIWRNRVFAAHERQTERQMAAAPPK